MRTEDIKLFHQIVETGSMVHASEILDLPKSNLSRRLKGLEEELNILLFHRQNRSMLLTEAGEKFYKQTKPILNQLENTIQEVTAPSNEIGGHLRIQLLPLPDLLMIGKMIFKFMDLYPKITVEVLTSSEDKNLAENHVDVAFRIGVGQSLKDSSLIARPFKSAQLNFYASPGYIREHGHPTSTDKLKNHNVIRFRAPDGQIHSQLPIGKTHEAVEVSGNLVINSVPLIIESGLLGRGIVFIPDSIANHYVEKGELVQLFDNIESAVHYGWLVYPSRKHLSLTARTFVDYMLSNVEQDPTCTAHPQDIQKMLI
ncbi:LysR family transcriptional regulator [Photobacterium sp.]|uniref:LysR family transcriptional regulator n=1 Tax=Photobacterium sp. TaxID=660 RepID=UPI00299ED141|nr:LysR family transcriptional regulator [Photobacterium sp.]MDX1301857.1 LysR family transcriptional regulator [Photobacterium sp.]